MAGRKRKQSEADEPADGETGAREGRPDEPQPRAPEPDDRREAPEDELPHH